VRNPPWRLTWISRPDAEARALDAARAMRRQCAGVLRGSPIGGAAYHAAEAVDDILQGASALSFPETLQALQWLGEVDDALAAAGLDLGGLLAATGLDQYLPDGWPL